MLGDCDHRNVRRSVTHPETGTRFPRHRGHVVAGTAVALGGALGYVALADPHSPASIYPPCPFRWLTGLNCPFCGGLRMTYDVLHGDLAAAVHDNAFALVAIPMLAAWVLVRRARGTSPLSTPALVTGVIATVAWTVLRNLPAFPWIPTVLGG